DKQDNVICKDGVCWIDTSTKTARTQNLEQRIVYTAIYEGNFRNKTEIYTCDLDGKNERRLTFNECLDDHPVFSPDGKKIAFTSLRDGNMEIYLMNNNGTKQKNITKSLLNESFPYFHPDGKKILFIAKKNGFSQAFEMDLTSKNIRQLTYSNNNVTYASYSPDGKKIVYNLYCGGNRNDVVIEDIETKEKRVLIEDGSIFGCYPRWSSDGRMIVFNKGWINNEGYAKMKVCLYDLKTGNIDELTDGSFEDGQPSFSPDNKKIIFYSDRDGVEYELYSMDLNGRNIKKLTSGGKYKNMPSISNKSIFDDSVDEIKLRKESTVDVLYESNFPEVKENNLNDILNSTGVVIVDAYAVWCGPCKHYSKNAIEPASKKYPNVRFVKMDAEKNREISKQYDIIAYPTTLIFKNGKFVDKFIGADGGKLEEMIKKYSQ
ncbi:MAG: thioredoxin domain-containing protein, partial [Candidatus Pacearchaeota archaeon]